MLVADSRANIRDFTHGKVYSIMVIGYEKVRSFIQGSGGVANISGTFSYRKFKKS